MSDDTRNQLHLEGKQSKKGLKTIIIRDSAAIREVPKEPTESAPQPLIEALLSHQQLLDLQHFGMLMLIWSLRAYMPCKVSEIQRQAHVGRKLFWHLVDDLEKAGLIHVHYNRFSPIFHAFITPALKAQVESTPALKAHVANPGLLGRGSSTPALEAGVIEANESLINRDLATNPGLLGRGSPSVVVVGSKTAHATTTQPPTPASEAHVDLDVNSMVGSAIRDIQRVAPHIHTGMLKPHARDAVQACHGDLAAASERIRRAIWYTVDMYHASNGRIRSILGLLRQAVRDGLTSLSPAEKQAREREKSMPKLAPEPEPIDRTTAPLDELLQYVKNVIGYADAESAIEGLSSLYAGHPQLDEVVAETRRAYEPKIGGLAAATV
ncbi:MAG: hypothetical protein WC683_17470 [bacterium]